jgi:hypothetical protein
MSGGFSTVPDELRQTAGTIGDALGAVAGMVWQGPSGDYGHPGVQAGWGQFIEEMKAQVAALRDRANEHADGLRTAAEQYQDSDAESGHVLGGVFDSGIPGGGWAGGVAGVGHRLSGSDDSGIPGGGWAGGVSGVGHRLGGDDDDSGIPGGGWAGGVAGVGGSGGVEY